MQKLPSLLTWAKKFKPAGSLKSPRCTLADTNVAARGLGALDIGNRSNITVVDLYPGLGTWTAALANGGFKRVISLEPQPLYYNSLMEDHALTSKVEIIKKDGYDWETYLQLKEPEFLGELADPDWNKVHPHILFTGTLPKSARGEQLLAQFGTCIVNKMAMHSLGRIQMAFWIPDQLYKKFSAPPGSSARCKMSVVTEACASVNLIHTTSPSAFYPHSEYHLVHIVPFEKKKVKADWDVIQYVMKHLFVMQRQPLSKTIKTLGPGADIILGRLSFDTSITVGELSAEQIDEVALKFDQWPLRPRVLFEDESMYT